MSKKVHILGGPNGVGKSTLGNHYSRDQNIKFINPDEIRVDQARLHSTPLSQTEFLHVLDTFICTALETEEIVLIENNLHEQDSFRFLLSYINKYNAESFCYFYYLDDVNELLKRVKIREQHLGHFVSPETVIERYKGSYNMIIENINLFDEIHFFDASSKIPDKVFEVLRGEINYINEDVNYAWSDTMMDKILEIS